MSLEKMLLALEITRINDAIEADFKKNGQDVDAFVKELDAYVATLPSSQTVRTNLFILAQPADLRVGYAANPNINELANKWTLDCLVSLTADEFCDFIHICAKVKL